MDPTLVRRELTGRPLVVLAAALIVGLTAREYLPNLLLLALLLLWAETLRYRAAICMVFCFGVVLAPGPAMELIPGYFSAEGRVASQPTVVNHRRAAEFISDGSKFSLVDPSQQIEFGQRVQVVGRIAPLRVADTVAADRGIRGRVTARKLTVVADPLLPFQVSNRFRSNLRRFLDAELPAEQAALVGGMCLSANDSLPEANREQMRATGTVHLVSSSGLHVLCLAGMLVALLSLLPIPRHYQIAIVTVLLAGYLVASGLHPATFRAVLMAVVGLFAYRVHRTFDLLSALSLAALLDLLARPTDVFELGFQLSFITVAAFGLFSSHADRKPIRQMLGASTLSALATMPIIAQRLGVIGFGSVFANVLTIVTLPLVIGGTYAAFLLSAFSPGLGHALLVPVAISAGWFGSVVEFFAAPGWILSVPGFSGYWIAALYGTLLLMWRPRIVIA